MTYIHQRKVLAYLRKNFKFLENHYYYFDMAKFDVEKFTFEYKVFKSKKAYKLKVRLAQDQDLFHIIVRPNEKNEIILGVNGDGFNYFENLSTGEIEYDTCSFGEIDPINIKLEMLQLARELNSGKAT